MTIEQHKYVAGILYAGTNDKAGGPHYMLKFMSPLSIKSNSAPLTDWTYKYMQEKWAGNTAGTRAHLAYQREYIPQIINIWCNGFICVQVCSHKM